MKSRVIASLLMLAFIGTLIAQDSPVVSPSAPTVAPKEETHNFDEVTTLKLQNGLLRIQKAQADIEKASLVIQMAQDQGQKDIEAFMATKGLNKNDWILDQQRLILVRKTSLAGAPAPVK